MDSGFEDLLAMVEEVNDGFEDDLRGMLRRGISLYEGDDDGNVYEIAPDGRRFLVALEGDKLVRVDEIKVIERLTPEEKVLIRDD